jgi:ATP-dependent phosphofructokinase / diphosphate-dependent phosphofructokinase
LLCEAIKTQLKIKRVRGDTLGYLQRSFLGCVSDVDAREAREVGAQAVHHAFATDSRDGSVALQRLPHAAGDYGSRCVLLPLQDVAGKTRTMEDAFIAEAGNNITPAFVDYLRPLLGSGLPVAATLRAAAVSRILKR